MDSSLEAKVKLLAKMELGYKVADVFQEAIRERLDRDATIVKVMAMVGVETGVPLRSAYGTSSLSRN